MVQQVGKDHRWGCLWVDSLWVITAAHTVDAANLNSHAVEQRRLLVLRD